MLYKIVDAGDTEDLEELVGSEIEDGWRPTGGLAASTYTYTDHRGQEKEGTTWAQAMVKTDAVERLGEAVE